jgi:hypothetical protein
MSAIVLRDAAGAGFDGLPFAVRSMHGESRLRVAIGRGDVEIGPGVLARLLAALLRLPRAGRDQALSVQFQPEGAAERWTRRFGDRGFSSRVSAEDGLLVERIYGVAVLMRAAADAAGVTLRLTGTRLLGIPLPVALAPRFTARISAPQCLYRFEVSIDLPLVGRLVRYSGWLAPPRAPEQAA